MGGRWGTAAVAVAAMALALVLPGMATAAEYRDWDESETKVVSPARALAGAVRTSGAEGAATRAVVAVATTGGPEVTIAERDGDGWFAFELPVGRLEERQYNVLARLYDGDQLIAIAPWRSIVVDATPPALTFNAIRRWWRPADAPIAVSWQVEPGATTTCGFGLAALPPAPCDGWFSVPAFSDGAYALTVVAADEAGNARSYVQPLTFDNAAPSADLIGGPGEGSLAGSRSAVFGIAVTDANPGPSTCAVDGYAVTCGERLELHDLVDGPHGATVTAADLAGNTTTVTRDWTVDATAPWLTLDGPADGARLPAGPVAYAAAAVDTSPLTLACRWDAAEPSPCGDRFQRTLAAGEHRFEATATDAAGNVRALARTVVVAAASGEQPPGESAGEQPPPGGGSPSTPPPPGDGAGRGPRGAARLVATLTAPRRLTAAALRRGVRLTARCSRACRGTLRLQRGGRTLARAPLVAAAATPTRVTVRLARAGGLPRGSRLAFALTVTGADGGRAGARLTRALASG